MSDKCFVDTNILVYAHDRSAGTKRLRSKAIVEQLWNSGLGVLSTQVLQELCINLRRKIRQPLSAIELRQLLVNYSSWEIVTNTPASVIEALEIEDRYKVSFWDALILQAADSAGASILYSEDLSANQKYRGTRVINPFL